MLVQQKYNYKVLECGELEYHIIGKAVKEQMKQMIEYYEEEIANAEACAMNSRYKGMWDMKINTLRKEYANMIANYSSILINYQEMEVVA